ncbi:helix-turn-helix transcriptional regulator [Staphylococcus aureus]|jgi:transcriptional regulator with XRE-family HTH domain|uniref:helix-turn-helix transcriptional regulator n=2 Tax=Bacilli TaxID=91061 RepID=UPI00085BCC0B|nr:helix-turn-helix transcriptional regulator [Staphylococcus aureus]MBU6105434.1 helix-turn-helix domain-containing protein [Staphylococcus aureus]MBU6936727.1 helix-turn-helix domain-containing protein [Staphylococcus aureus]MDG6507602.1 helix-turn-helix transcriptional regulator [Staphylococcus aureus]MDG6666540.1 helix-turn-helix transcriptional regulator [Staphylococcus aureus]MDG6749200.1 helix-turn-helix transcriptional regulator [Staphylococcus aureus]
MLGRNIKLLRISENLSQDDLAKKIKVSKQSIYVWEKGEVLPDCENLMILSKYFDISIDSLVNTKLSISKTNTKTSEK